MDMGQGHWLFLGSGYDWNIKLNSIYLSLDKEDVFSIQYYIIHVYSPY